MGHCLKKSKSSQSALALAQAAGVDYDMAFRLTESIWTEVRRSIRENIGIEAWKRLSRKERAEFCTRLVKALLDRNNVVDFLAGNKKRLLT